MKTLILGAAYVDVVVKVPQLPRSGEDVTGNFQANIVGGSAINVYGAMRTAGVKADLFVPVGQGQYATVVRQFLEHADIPELLSVNDADNGWDLSLVEPNGERTFLTISGVDQIWHDDWFERIDLTDYQYVYISGYQLENPVIADQILARIHRQKPAITILFDASPRISYLAPAIRDQLLTVNVMIHCNEVEFEQFNPTQQPLKVAMQRVYDQTHCPVIVTLGNQGACYCDGTTVKTVPALETVVGNTIGAGDAHCGGLLAGLSQGQSFPNAMKLANELSAKVVAQESGCL
ncbi:PfkB family carbohydrate kinase [Secundilactobacillus similis]|uniref:Ribokinase family sugar kinase n=1 Tax=Secundilactobacillus similis DSM 23365 = JCM 2765 TaxID=1423804 RepID=A0A0R2EZN3_9LACO|nr:PfkB family carbohydrate kinase [Secundilactobacillus similis]KRN21523.1 ribokinase family sugar kinase [Secundilactobacillus similis DSM 23365 = JCM 2765]